MITRRETRIVYWVVAFAVIIIAFMLLGGGPWVRGMGHMGHGNGSLNMTSLRWGQILIGLGLGFLLGWFASRKKW